MLCVIYKNFINLLARTKTGHPSRRARLSRRFGHASLRFFANYAFSSVARRDLRRFFHALPSRHFTQLLLESIVKLRDRSSLGGP